MLALLLIMQDLPSVDVTPPDAVSEVVLYVNMTPSVWFTKTGLQIVIGYCASREDDGTLVLNPCSMNNQDISVYANDLASMGLIDVDANRNLWCKPEYPAEHCDPLP